MANGVPQIPQNKESGSRSLPQLGHEVGEPGAGGGLVCAVLVGVPQTPQNVQAGSGAVPHVAHVPMESDGGGTTALAAGSAAGAVGSVTGIGAASGRALPQF